MNDLIERLRQAGEATALATRKLAEAKSQRNRAAGDADADYRGLEAHQTVEWRAADRIERLEAALDKIKNRYPCQTADTMSYVATDALGSAQTASLRGDE